MPRLVPGIHAFLRDDAWMAVTSPAMTVDAAAQIAET